MNSLVTYLLYSAVMLAVMYTVYWLFLRRDTFFHVNRFYLLATLGMSLVVPLFDIRPFTGGPFTAMVVMLDPVVITPGKVDKAITSYLSWFQVAGVIYFTGVAIFTIRFVVQLIQIGLIVRRNRIRRIEGLNIVFVDRGYSPFSFFNLVFIRKEYTAEGKLTPVLAHEKVHIRQHHSLDLILTEVLVIVQWFNPFAWFLDRSVKGIHEYLADEGVLKEGYRENEYHALILNEAMGLQVNNLTNNFNILLIQKRLAMMTKARSAAWTPVKVMFAVPALLAVFLLFSAGSMNYLSAQDNTKKAATAEKTKPVAVSEQAAQGEPIFEKVETPPEYPGGMGALTEFLVNNIKYPQQALKDSIQGKVFVTFVVEKDGSISNIKILRGIGGGCDEEALRVTAIMPKWVPGKQKGQPVRVQMALPFQFTLKKDKAPASKTGQK